MVGAEGTAGIVTRATLRLMREPQAHRTMLAIFADVERATAAVSAIIAAGIIPGAIEMMDALIIRAVEAAFNVGFPADAGAVLISRSTAWRPAWRARRRIARIATEAGAVEVKLARDEAERALLWKARKRAFGAVGAARARTTPPRTASCRAPGCPTSCA